MFVVGRALRVGLLTAALVLFGAGAAQAHGTAAGGPAVQRESVPPAAYESVADQSLALFTGTASGRGTLGEVFDLAEAQALAAAADAGFAEAECTLVAWQAWTTATIPPTIGVTVTLGCEHARSSAQG